MWSIRQLAYLAGIIDGEGSIGIEKLSPYKSRKKTYYAARLCIINTDIALIHWLKENFTGGSWNERKVLPHQKRCYRWHIFGTNLERLLIAVRPYLIIKTKQADCVIQFRKTVSKTNRSISEETSAEQFGWYDACRIFNKTGRKS